MSRTLWAVSEGSYSDYRVLAVFEDKEDAERMVSDSTLGGEGVEEMPYFVSGEQPERATIYAARGTLGTMDVNVYYERVVHEGGYDWPPPHRPQVRESAYYQDGVRRNEIRVTGERSPRGCQGREGSPRSAPSTAHYVRLDNVRRSWYTSYTNSGGRTTPQSSSSCALGRCR